LGLFDNQNLLESACAARVAPEEHAFRACLPLTPYAGATTEVAMDYPQDFPAESRARIEVAMIRAGRQFDLKKAKAKCRSDVEVLFSNYVLTPFVLFAMESSRLGLWQADEMDGRCRDFLRLFTIDAYYRKGKAAGLRDMISNWNGGIVWEAQQKMEGTLQWRRYENILLKFAAKQTESSRAQNSGKTTQKSESKPTGRPRKDAERELVRKLKANGKSWKDIAAEINTQTGKDKSPEAYRGLLKNRANTPGKNVQK